MKRLIATFSLLGVCAHVAFAGKWDFIAKAGYVASKHPDAAFSVMGFLIDLFLMCIPIAIVSGIVTLIIKAVFETDKDDTMQIFCVIGGILLAIWLLLYFLL